MNRYLLPFALVALTVLSARAIAEDVHHEDAHHEDEHHEDEHHEDEHHEDEHGHHDHGHHEHFDVFIGAASGQTAYGGIDVDLGNVTLNQRAFPAEMRALGNIFIASKPGINHPEDDDKLPSGVTSLSAGDQLFVRTREISLENATADLFFWDGDGEVSFTPATGVSFDIVTPEPQQSIGTAGFGGGFDDHPLFELSAGGSLPTSGIYLGSFEMQVEDLDPTDSLFLVMGTDGLITPALLGISQNEFDLLTDDDLDEALEERVELAVEYVEHNVIPEPSAALLVLIASLGLTIGRVMRMS